MAHRRRAEAAPPAAKTCASCGRRVEWRPKWADSWEDVRYCSAACRGRGVGPQDRDLEDRILAMLSRRAATATVCPSEVARAASAAQGDDGEAWRELMEPARRAARRLVARGDVVITQGGRVVDPSTAKGPLRIRRA
jgi:hypothetical protein